MPQIFLEIDDTSPQIAYAPFRDTFAAPDLAAGWNPYFSLSGFAAAQGDTGNGTTQHITSLDGASLSIQWHGTGIQLMGNITNTANYSISLDGTSNVQPNVTNLQGSILANFQGLDDADHVIALTAHIPDPSASLLMFDKAILISAAPASSNGNEYSSQPLNDSSIAFLGEWLLQNASTSDDGTASRESHTAGDRAQASFIGASLLITGSTSPTAGNYTVTLDGSTNTSLSARSSFTQPNTTLFFASGLDPTMTHTVQVRNDGGGDLRLDVNDGFVVEATASPDPPSAPSFTPSAPITASSTLSPFPKGTVAALVLGGILVFLILSGLLYTFLVYRPRKLLKRRRTHLVFTQHNGGGAGGRFSAYSPKAEEFANEMRGGDVLDISPRLTQVQHPQNEPQRQRGSGKSSSGFRRWKREMEIVPPSGPGGGLDFRHSEGYEKGYGAGLGGAPPSGGYAYYDESPKNGGEESAPVSTKSSIFSISSSMRAKIRKSKGKAKARASQQTQLPNGGSSYSPSFALNLRFAGAGSGDAGRGRGRGYAEEEDELSREDDDEEEASAMQTLSYATASPVLTPPAQHRQPRQQQQQLSIAPPPPSYAVSISHSTPPSVPRSISSDSPPINSNTNNGNTAHNRDGSRGFLLHYGEANPGSPQDDEDSPAPSPASAPLAPSKPPLPPIPQSSSSIPPPPSASKPSKPKPLPLPPILPTGLLPLDAMTKEERGSVLDYYAGDDGMSVLGAGAAQSALRSLSPRTAKMGVVGAGAAADQGAPRQQQQQQQPASGSGQQRQQPPPPPPPLRSAEVRMPPSSAGLDPGWRRGDDGHEVVEVRDGIFLSVRETSPFTIDFPKRSPPSAGPAPAASGGVYYPAASGSISGGAVAAAAGDAAGEPSRRTTRVSGLSHVHFDPSTAEMAHGQSARRSMIGNPNPSSTTGESPQEFVQGTSKSTFRLTPMTLPPTPGGDRATVTSFLDLGSGGSSRSESFRSRSNNTTDSSERERNWEMLTGLREPDRSRWSNTTSAPSMAATHHERATAAGEEGASSSSSGGASSQLSPGSLASSTFPIPFQVSIPPSPYHPAHVVPTQSTQHVSDSSHGPAGGAGLHVHPHIEDLESPTESIPMTVSDLNFRHSRSDSLDPDSHRTSSNAPHPSHPPLPGLEQEVVANAVPGSGANSALSTPNYIVQRVLSMPSPTASFSTHPGHSRADSSSAFLHTPRPADFYDTTRNNQPSR